ncbi:hypothetical protein V1L54_12885 [Streptomyces sp. TRM 70361]|uniref:hypothetical protein n=1 Tax=Streptomyces sp. TRM 70361 TaxID=3116553 RepID=UPI002E7AB32E|nr:hypothetical protein [Streptomyces sp. TRM 70361]MEE1940288.1 hypothetical protein [Streptomyces sp. TRM 70361]
MRRSASGAAPPPPGGTDSDPFPTGPAGPPRAAAEPIRTEFEFELPRGYVDESGTVHRHGAMRLATARDELLPLADLRVKENPAYLSVVLLGLVITRIGTVTDVHGGVVEKFFASDLAFLQDFYRRINAEGHTRAAVTCPECDSSFEVDLAGGRLGES